ncbi:MAG: cell envelope integrity protein CreD [Pseudomonadota bacterium]
MFRNTLFIKCVTIATLILLLLIPLTMIRGIVFERNEYRESAVWDIADSWTGAQTLFAPLIRLPYEQRYTETLNKGRGESVNLEKTRTAYYLILAHQFEIDTKVTTQLRKRGIYSTPVYDAQVNMSGEFLARDIARLKASTKGFVRWGTPNLILGVADLRGIGAKPSLDLQGQTYAFEPGTSYAKLGNGIHAPLPEAALSRDLPFTLSLTLRGSQQLHLIPTAADARIHMQSDWQHPKFVGRFLPSTRSITDEGFTAEWSVSAFSTGANDFVLACQTGNCSGRNAMSLGVSFIETVDVYTQTDRATKYAILFILLTFVAFLLTETLTDRRLHPVHYLLVGAALSIFYLLLISLAEHTGFAMAYCSATAACTALIWFYLKGVFGDTRLAAIYAGAIAALYATLYMILRSEDFALLMGSLLLFGALALIMLSTRRLDWHRISMTLSGRPPSADRDDPGNLDGQAW